MITDMHDLNGALFLKVSCLSLMLCALVRLKLFSLSQENMHHYSHTNLILAEAFKPYVFLNRILTT